MKKVKFILGLLIVAGLFRWSTIFIIVGMLPGMMSRLTDRSPNKIYCRIVGGFNLAGLLPFAVDLWNSGNSWGAVAGTMTNMNVWLAVYGAAAIGWGLILFLPSLVILIMSGSNQAKITEAQQAQQKLLDDWGNQLSQYD